MILKNFLFEKNDFNTNYRLTNADLKISLYAVVHTKIIP